MPARREQARHEHPGHPDARWQHVLRRDRSKDGHFFYAVKTTGVYCRPSCPSRRANPANVSFFESGALAERAGFRPCKRCRPDALSADQHLAAKVAAACRAIERAPDAPPALAALASEAALSPYHFHRLFKAKTGLTPREYARALRDERMRNALGQSASVSAAIYDAGFKAPSRFYETSQEVLGMKPSTYRQGGKHTRLTFSLGRCSLGHILVAHSERGVCAILLGDDPEALLADLRDRFPRAELAPGDARHEDAVTKVVALVDAPRVGLDLPLDVRGTAFQRRVWRALRALKPGSTVTYAELARRIGAPSSVRAVAQACSQNPLAVAVPCHRVVQSRGGLGGYRWGVERKRALLSREQDAP